MKTLQHRFLLVLAIFFILVAAVQYLRLGALAEKRQEHALTQAGRRIFHAEQRRENNLWIAQQQAVSATARLFRDLLYPAPESAAPPRTDVPVLSDREASLAVAAPPFRSRIGEGESAWGIFVPRRPEAPPEARAVAAAWPRLQGYFSSLPPSVASAYFISRENWLIVLPARKAMDLHDGHDFSNDPLLLMGTPENNPARSMRFTRPRREESLGKWVISVTVPVYLEGGFQGVVGHDITLESMLASLESDPGLPGISHFIMDDDFRVVLHRDLAPLFNKPGFDPGPKFEFNASVNDKPDQQVIAMIARERAFPAERLLRLGDGPTLLLSARHPDSGWHAVQVMSLSVGFAHAGRVGAAFFPLHVLLPLLAGLVLLFLFLKTTLLDPLARLDESLLPSGTGGRRRPTRVFPELGKLHADMEHVIAQLQEQVVEGRETKTSLDTLLRTAPSMVVTMDARMRPIAINDYGRQRFQFNPEAVPALRAGDFFEKEFRREIAIELKDGDQVSGKETTMTLKSGEKVDISLSLSRMRDARGEPKGYLAIISDISKRRKAELDLKNQILFSRQIFQSIPEMIIIVDRRLRITFINKRSRELIPTGSSGIIGQNINSILAKNSLESGFDELVRSVLEGGGSVHRINTLNPVLEEENYVDLIVEPLKSGSLIIGGIIMLRDISEWRGLTAQLRSLQGFMQKLINASPYAVISFNEHGLITTWNSAAERILGVSFAGAFGKNLYALLPLFGKYKDAINEVMILKKTVYLNDEQVFIGDEDFKVANFTFYPVTGEQSGVVIHMEDVSALKKLESSLIHAQKMESLGLLTSHIIHDFNNLLSGIMGYASLLEKKIADNPKVQKYVSTIITSSERASTLINQLLNFSRKKMAEKEILNVNDLIKEALDFLAMNLKSINLDIQLYQSQILLQADKTKISQILINLIVNARDALESVERPILRLRTDRVEISEQGDLLDGQYALISISDNGGGISHENQKKIFEPFFTTKGQGRGTGLGLAIVREIIQDYNGRIELDSQVGHGTTFTILLPVFEQTLYQPPPHDEPEANTPLEGLVLLIDDEEVVREIGSDMLKTMGLKSLTAVSGSEGIELFKKHAGDISLVILDIEMPGISGEKVFHILRELRPDVKILIASGYGRDYLENEVFKSKIDHFMPKPFKTEQLSYQVNRLLRGGDV